MGGSVLSSRDRTTSILATLTAASVIALGAHRATRAAVETFPGATTAAPPATGAVEITRVSLAGGPSVTAGDDVLGYGLRCNPASSSSRFVVEVQWGTTTTFSAVIVPVTVTGATLTNGVLSGGTETVAPVASRSTIAFGSCTGGTFYGGSSAFSFTLGGVRKLTKLTPSGSVVDVEPTTYYYEKVQFRNGTTSALQRLHVVEVYGGGALGMRRGGGSSSGGDPTLGGDLSGTASAATVTRITGTAGVVNGPAASDLTFTADTSAGLLFTANNLAGSSLRLNSSGAVNLLSTDGQGVTLGTAEGASFVVYGGANGGIAAQTAGTGVFAVTGAVTATGTVSGLTESCGLTLSGNQALVAATPADVLWTTEEHDASALHAANSATVTIASTRIHSIKCYLNFDVTSGQVQLRLLKNGNLTRLLTATAGAGGATLTLAEDMSLAATDALKIVAYSQNGGNVVASGGSALSVTRW